MKYRIVKRASDNKYFIQEKEDKFLSPWNKTWISISDYENINEYKNVCFTTSPLTKDIEEEVFTKLEHAEYIANKLIEENKRLRLSKQLKCIKEYSDG